MKFDSRDSFDAVSALADGQLRGEEFAQAVDRINLDSKARGDWHSYHVVGDVLRATELSSNVMDDAGFVSRFQARLAKEASVGMDVLPRKLPEFSSTPVSNFETSERLNKPSANDAGFKWKVLAGCASMAAVAAIGWSALVSFNSLELADKAQQMAVSPAPLVLPAPVAEAPLASSIGTGAPPKAGTGTFSAGVMIRDPNLDALLAAHRQFGGSSALQMPTGFLRNATFEGAAR